MLRILEKQLGYAFHIGAACVLDSRYSLPGACPSMPFYQQTPECASDLNCLTGWPLKRSSAISSGKTEDPSPLSLTKPKHGLCKVIVLDMGHAWVILGPCQICGKNQGSQGSHIRMSLTAMSAAVFTVVSTAFPAWMLVIETSFSTIVFDMVIHDIHDVHDWMTWGTPMRKRKPP